MNNNHTNNIIYKSNVNQSAITNSNVYNFDNGTRNNATTYSNANTNITTTMSSNNHTNCIHNNINTIASHTLYYDILGIRVTTLL